MIFFAVQCTCCFFVVRAMGYFDGWSLKPELGYGNVSGSYECIQTATLATHSAFAPPLPEQRSRLNKAMDPIPAP